MNSAPTLDAYWFHEKEWDSYEQLYEEFEHEIPDTMNIADYVCDRWAYDKKRVAVFTENEDGEERTFTFWQLRRYSNKLANYLSENGVERGDRVVVTGVQKPESLISYLAVWKMGAVVVPVSKMFGEQALEYRLNDCSAVAMVVDEANANALGAIKDNTSLELVLSMEEIDLPGSESLWDAIEPMSAHFENAVLDSEDDIATIMYTSGTTGDPKGVVMPPRTLLSRLPGFLFNHADNDIQDGDLFWVLAEWSWIGIYATVLPSLFFGAPVFGHDHSGFNPENVFKFVDKYGISYFGASTTAFRMMKQIEDIDRYDLSSVRAITPGGEAIGEDVLEWILETFDNPAVNHVYGQTEADIPLGECAALGKNRRGSIGVPIPGQQVAILDPDTQEPLEDGELGEIAIVYEGRPIGFKRYLNKPDATAEKIQNGWLLTEDLGIRDEDGYFWFHSRKDDVIISSGYRIGPKEIEETLSTHDDVADAGVIGVPHETRGEIAKAFVVVASTREPSEELKEELQDYVKNRLAKYEYPREIEFIDELPTTTTGKLKRNALYDL